MLLRITKQRKKRFHWRNSVQSNANTLGPPCNNGIPQELAGIQEYMWGQTVALWITLNRQSLENFGYLGQEHIEKRIKGISMMREKVKLFKCWVKHQLSFPFNLENIQWPCFHKMLHTPCWKAEETDFYVHSKNSTEMACEFCGERCVQSRLQVFHSRRCLHLCSKILDFTVHRVGKLEILWQLHVFLKNKCSRPPFY